MEYDDYPHILTPEQRSARRAAREAERHRRRRRRRQRQFRRLAPWVVAIVAVLVLIPVGRHFLGQRNAAASQMEAGSSQGGSGSQDAAASQSGTGAASSDGPGTLPQTVTIAFAAHPTADTVELGADFPSAYAVVIDLDSHDILAEKGAESVISPASMTKILTVLVAAEHVTDLDDTFTITTDITDFCYQHDCSAVGFSVGETVSIRDLFYGTVLPSGGDAALALAVYVAGSQEKFVTMMNNKLRELGLSDTAHFTNCIGLYHVNHRCTVYDMAVMLEAAMENELCREVLSAHTYTTTATAQHPEGIVLSNWFLRRIEDKDMGEVSVLGAKTGFVKEAGSCAASYAVRGEKAYLCVTAQAYSAWRCIYDHVALYKQYCNEE